MTWQQTAHRLEEELAFENAGESLMSALRRAAEGLPGEPASRHVGTPTALLCTVRAFKRRHGRLQQPWRCSSSSPAWHQDGPGADTPSADSAEGNQGRSWRGCSYSSTVSPLLCQPLRAGYREASVTSTQPAVVTRTQCGCEAAIVSLAPVAHLAPASSDAPLAPDLRNRAAAYAAAVRPASRQAAYRSAAALGVPVDQFRSPLFRPIARHGRIGVRGAAAGEGRLSAAAVRLVVWHRRREVSLDPDFYTAQSLRSGFTTQASAAANERTPSGTAGVGRYRSRGGYVQRGNLFTDNTAARLGL